jgi:hypothetical protein
VTLAEHIRQARRFERTAAMLQVRGITEPTPPDTFWRLAEVHRAWARKLARA